MAGLAAAALAAVSAVALALAPPANVVPAKTVFSKSPYMGVSCSTPNSTACDRFGLAVWLRRPAVAVDAEVGGRWLSLDDQQWSGPVRHHKRKMFAGFMHHAGL